MKRTSKKQFGITLVHAAFALASAALITSCSKKEEEAPPPAGGGSNVVNVTENITSNTTWSASNEYVLNGWVFVKNGAVLTIEAGTIIKGDKASKAALIITKGSKIMAEGTASKPIVFTSNLPAGQRTYGDWGGLIVLGNARINSASGSALIEGGLTAPDGEYGGLNDADNSGVLKYIRIEYPGIPFQPNNEINGLTFGGVGSGTTVEYVQVSYSGDDSFEFFGGTVNAKHLVSLAATDDDFDTDFGFSGKLQFLVALRDPNVADISGSNGFESDNDATGSANMPVTAAVFSNVSIIGPSNGGTINSNFKRAAHLRRNTMTSVFNSILAAYPTGLLIDGTSCEVNADNNSLQFQNNFIAGCTIPLAVASGSTWDINAYFSNQPGNVIYMNNTDILSSNAFNLANPDMLPFANSPALAGASFTNPKLTDSFFEQVDYRGAFGINNWASGWSNWNAQNTEY